jgi:hypothetical protein
MIVVNIMTSLSDLSNGNRSTTANPRMTDDRSRDAVPPAQPAPAAAPNGGHRSREEHLAWVLEQVRQTLVGMRFGQVVITVQDGLAIQIERTEKTRLR